MSSTWALTAYFNPLHWRSRLENFRRFRAEFRDDVPLCVVEWSPDGSFELTADDADRLVQIAGGDLLWQKERLLNVGLERLPAGVDAVALLDADVVFPQRSVGDLVAEALRQADYAQLFDRSFRLEAGVADRPLASIHADARKTLAARQSIAAVAARAADPAGVRAELLVSRLRQLRLPVPDGLASIESRERSLDFGLAAAARLTWLREIGGLPDRFVIGGADGVICHAVLGTGSRLIDAYAAGGMGCYDCSAVRDWLACVAARLPRIGAVEADVIQLFHGAITDRHYASRHRILAESGIDLDRHLALTDRGAWRWATGAPADLPERMVRYFESRREDGDR